MVENEIAHRRINLHSYYCMRGADGTHEELMQHLDKKHEERQTPEYIAEAETQLKKIVDSYNVEMDKISKSIV